MVKRLFIGIKIPIEKQLLESVEEIKKLLKNDYIKWVEINNLHLTLLFLGDTDETIIPNIIYTLQDIDKLIFPFKISLKELGVFKNVYQPRVIWIGVKPVEPMQKLKNEIDIKIGNLGLNVKFEESFHPHFTLGRPKNIRNKSKLKSLLDQNKNTVFQEVIISYFQLFESKLTSKGPIYSIVKNFPLKSNPITFKNSY